MPLHLKEKIWGFSLSGENHNTDRKCQSAVNLSGKRKRGETFMQWMFILIDVRDLSVKEIAKRYISTYTHTHTYTPSPEYCYQQREEQESTPSM